MIFEIDQKLGFEVPLSNVSRCVGAKNEVIMEFHNNEDCPVQLMEMRLHMPQDLNEKTEENDILEVKNLNKSDTRDKAFSIYTVADKKV